MNTHAEKVRLNIINSENIVRERMSYRKPYVQVLKCLVCKVKNKLTMTDTRCTPTTSTK